MVTSGEGLSVLQVVSYFGAHLLGGCLGTALCWLAYRDHFDLDESDPDSTLALFATAPEIRNPPVNVATKIIGTFVLVLVLVILAHAVLPIRGKGASNWSYAWVPVVGPLTGGALAGVAARVVGYA